MFNLKSINCEIFKIVKFVKQKLSHIKDKCDLFPVNLLWGVWLIVRQKKFSYCDLTDVNISTDVTATRFPSLTT